MNNLKTLAQEMGIVEISRRIQRAETLVPRSQTHVGIIGRANCGKTTLLNGVLQQEVRTPSVLPSNGLPLRVVFDQSMDDERFECVHVFQRDWCNADAVLYEFSSDKVLKDEQCTDELDIVFYLSPLAHFLTAEDRKTLQCLEGLPVQIIATQCDRVAADDQDKARQFAVKACERLSLAAPIFAEPDSWQSVSEKMRSVLPTTIELLENRKTHLLKIEKNCKRQIIDHIECMLEAEKNNQQALQAQYEERLRKEKLAFATANRIYQETKLRCSSASNEMVAMVRTGMQRIDGFAQQMIAEGRQCKFDEAFQQRLSRNLEGLLEELVLSIELNLSDSLKSIVSHAIAQNVLSEKDLQGLKQNSNLPRSSQEIHFDKSTGNELSYLLQSALGVGAVSVATLLSRATTPWTLCLITASTLVGGATYFRRNEISRTAKNEAAIRDWARSCSDNLQSTLVSAIQQAYKTLRDAMHLPPVEQTESTSMPTETEKAAQLRAILSDLKA